MTEFRCLAVASDGRRDWRRVEAEDEQACIAQLQAQGWVPLQVRAGHMSLAERLDQPIRLGASFGGGDTTLLMNQLAALVGSGLPVDRSLDLLRDQSGGRTQRALLEGLLGDVRAGSSLGQALERRGNFPQWAVGIIRSTELGGRLGDALRAVATRMTRMGETRRRLVTALTYPVAVLAATLVALVIVLTQVVPQFEPIFEGSEDRLPVLTQNVLWISAVVRDFGWTILAVTGAVGLAGWMVLRSDASANWRSKAARLIPGMGLRDQIISAQFTGLLSTLTGNGVQAVRALPLARNALPSRRWQTEIERVEQALREGERLSLALRHAPSLPTTAVRLIEVGERTGRLAEACGQASDIMAGAAEARVDRIVSLANPIAIILLGGMVAMLVAGVMLGIFALGDFAG